MERMCARAPPPPHVLRPMRRFCWASVWAGSDRRVVMRIRTLAAELPCRRGLVVCTWQERSLVCAGVRASRTLAVSVYDAATGHGRARASCTGGARGYPLGQVYLRDLPRADAPIWLNSRCVWFGRGHVAPRSQKRKTPGGAPSVAFGVPLS